MDIHRKLNFTVPVDVAKCAPSVSSACSFSDPHTFKKALVLPMVRDLALLQIRPTHGIWFKSPMAANVSSMSRPSLMVLTNATRLVWSPKDTFEGTLKRYERSWWNTCFNLQDEFYLLLLAVAFHRCGLNNLHKLSSWSLTWLYFPLVSLKATIIMFPLLVMFSYGYILICWWHDHYWGWHW